MCVNLEQGLKIRIRSPSLIMGGQIIQRTHKFIQRRINVH